MKRHGRYDIIQKMNGKTPETPERGTIVVFPRGLIEWELVGPGIERNLGEIFRRVLGNNGQKRESEPEPEAPKEG